MQAQPQMVGELCKVLQKKFRAANGSDQTKGLHYERYVIKLAKKLEPEFRNPFDNCRRVSASNCIHQVTSQATIQFFCMFSILSNNMITITIQHTTREEN